MTNKWRNVEKKMGKDWREIEEKWGETAKNGEKL